MHPFLVLTIALATCAATIVGGFFAIGMRDRLHLVLGFSAGAVLGVAFFDLMPEAIETSRTFDGREMLAIVALGFFFYVLLDRLVLLHSHGGHDHAVRRGWIGAASLSVHSFMDGFAIGVAFQAGHGIGYVVAAAVLVHDFSDGLNTVNVVVKNGAGRQTAIGWLLIDAIAPVVGASTSLLIALSQNAVAVFLAIFSGFFLYIGASDLLPESHHKHPRFFTTAATFAGAACLFIVTRIAG
ncbi:MAG TPA: ZIP family metal transporter [Rhizomicrobium sp.]|jgi:ZIP family zinc transporter|nr:ZIP family metal transporter [Rhizomicrobium sp.]